MTGTGSLGWFATHELRLAWRDWMSMMTAGQRRRERSAYIGVGVFVLAIHVLAYAMISGPLANGVVADAGTLVLLSGLYALAFSLMIPQAIESVTRAFYARADLDLLLSSPTSERTIFAVRVSAIVAQTSALALLLIVPFVVVAAIIDGPSWFAVFPAVLALAAIATSLAVSITFVLFKLIGPRRTRLVAQIVAAVMGAVFLIGTQIAAILSFGQMSRVKLFQSDSVIEAMPALDSWLWTPARAMLADPQALLILLAVALSILALTIVAFAGSFGRTVLIAANIGEGAVKAGTPWEFRCKTAAQALRQKEWRLLARDPWLVSQTLMQVLYLIPPAVLLWRNFSEGTTASVILAPVLVMAVGQLAGGLAWLAISGEDAHELVETAPVSPRQLTTAKVQSVLAVVAAASSPLIFAIAIADVWVGVVCAIFVLLASASSVVIQLMFRSQARRSLFRRRQAASKVSTFAEAFSSISWAGAAVMAAAGMWISLLFVGLALSVVAVARLFAPREV
ncbi:MAG: permease [Pseudomonadota bacterium]